MHNIYLNIYLFLEYIKSFLLLIFNSVFGASMLYL